MYKMNAGMLGTEQVYLHVAEEELNCSESWELAVDHAEQYSVYQGESEGFLDEDGEETSEPEIYLAATITNLAELEEYSDEILCGSDTLESLVIDLKSQGMVWS